MNYQVSALIITFIVIRKKKERCNLTRSNKTKNVDSCTGFALLKMKAVSFLDPWGLVQQVVGTEINSKPWGSMFRWLLTTNLQAGDTVIIQTSEV